MATIDLITFITHGCSEYAELLYKSCERFKSGKHTINYRAVETNGGAGKWPDMFQKMATTEATGHGFVNHALGIHKALELSKADIKIIIDSDICMLYQNWDRNIAKELEFVDIFGGGYSNYRTAKYYSFPAAHFICFKSLPVKLNFMPIPKDDNVERVDIDSEKKIKTLLQGNRRTSKM